MREEIIPCKQETKNQKKTTNYLQPPYGLNFPIFFAGVRLPCICCLTNKSTGTTTSLLVQFDVLVRLYSAASVAASCPNAASHCKRAVSHIIQRKCKDDGIVIGTIAAGPLE